MMIGIPFFVFEEATHKGGGCMESKSYFRNVVHAISEIYYTSIYINVLDDEYDAIQIAPWMKDYVAEKGVFSEMVNRAVVRTVPEQNRPAVFHHFSLANVREKLNKSALSEIHHSFYMDYQTIRNHSSRWVRATFALADSTPDGDPWHVMCMLQDITEDKDQATIDTVTGIYNRLYGMALINEALRSAEFEQGFLAIIDIDNFKQVNDRLGHQKGDEALVLFANCLSRYFSKRSVVFRLGGDEFGIFVESQDRDAVLEQFERLRDACRIKIQDEKRTVSISGSFGLVEIPKYGTRFNDLYAKADRALYFSKEHGKDRLTLYQPNMRIENDNYELIREFDYALSHDEIRVYFQPIIRSLNKKICGLEALTRWLHPKRGLIEPSSFIPVLEVKKQVHKLDLYVVRETVKQLHMAIQHDEVIVPVSINLSKFDFTNPHFFEEFEEIVREYEIDKRLINIEIKESLTVENPFLMQDEISKFREAGYEVWLDGFGVGYASLNLLQSYHFDALKLDRAFMTGFDKVAKNIAISVTGMGKNLGIHAMAVGVESEEQFEFLRHCGCEKQQGNFFGEPLSLRESIRQCEQKGYERERLEWKDYYDAADQIDYMTDRSMAIVEYDGTNFVYLYMNHFFREVLESIAVPDLDTMYETMNSANSPLSNQFRSFQYQLEAGGGTKELDYVLRGSYIRLTGKCLAEHDGHFLTMIGITNLTQGEAEAEELETAPYQEWAPNHAIERINSMDSSLWKSLLDSRIISLFWKDQHRRFIGANQKFLATFGFADLSTIIGKTDDDLGLNINSEVFRQDEQELLETGSIIINKQGDCYIRGVKKTILVNKEPLYQDGQIVGLFGYFRVLETNPEE